MTQGQSAMEQPSVGHRPARALSVRWKLFLSMAVPTGAVLALAFGFGLFALSQRMSAAVDADLAGTARQSALLFDAHLRAAARVADEAATALSVHSDLDEDALYALLRRNLKREPLVYGSAIAFEPDAFPGRRLFSPYVYRDGESVAWTDIAATAYDYTQPQWDWFNVPRGTRQTVWTEPYFDEGAGNILMSTYAVPVFRDDRFVAVVTADIPLQGIGAQLAANFAGQENFLVLSRTGRFVYNSYMPSLIGDPQPADLWFETRGRADLAGAYRRMLQARQGILHAPDMNDVRGGAAQLLSFEPIAAANWTFVAGVAEASALKPVRDAIYAGLALFVLLLALMLIVVWLATGTMTRRVAMVQHAAMRIADGDLSARSGVSDGDEIGRLAEAVDTMAAALDRREQEIGEINRGLESAVAKRTEELSRSEAQFRAVVDQLPSGVMVKDLEGGTLFVNEQARIWLAVEDMFDVLGAGADEFFAAETAAELTALDRAAAGGTMAREREMTLTWPDGRERKMLVSIFPINTEAGDLLALGTVVTDISSIRAAEAEVRRNEGIMRSILDQSPVSFALKDTNRNFLMVNKVGADWFGFDRDAMIGAPSDAVNRDDQIDLFAEADRQVLERLEVARPFEYRDEVAFRAPMDLMVHKFPVWGDEDELIGIGTIQTDITERKRAETDLHRAYTVIRESVLYASKMQRTLLPNDEDRAALGEHLMMWEPRDVVGGDIFWLRHTTKGLLVIVGDGTGHGVPGAFVTLVTTSALDQALLDHPEGDPAAVLEHMNDYVKRMLRQDVQEGEADDGMELGLCLIERTEGRLSFAGARFSLLKIAGGEAREIKGDKSGIGYRRVPVSTRFTNHVLERDPSATYYLVTDGFVDQVGGAKRRAFGKRRLTEKLLEIQDVPLPAQRDILLATLQAYQGEEARRDDITVVGFRVATPST